MIYTRIICLLLLLTFSLSTLKAQPTFSKRIEVESWSYPSQLTQLADGGFIITGFYSMDSIGNAQHFFFMKTDASGNLLWTKSADLPVVPQRNTVASSIGITGTHDSGFAIAIPIEPVFNGSFILAKFDVNGTRQWANQIDGNTSFIGTSVI